MVRWRCSEAEDPKSIMTLWFDEKLKIPVRMENNNREGYLELVNIRKGKPPSDLFKVPSGYRQLSFNIPTGRMNQ